MHFLKINIKGMALKIVSPSPGGVATKFPIRSGSQNPNSSARTG